MRPATESIDVPPAQPQAVVLQLDRLAAIPSTTLVPRREPRTTIEWLPVTAVAAADTVLTIPVGEPKHVISWPVTTTAQEVYQPLALPIPVAATAATIMPVSLLP